MDEDAVEHVEVITGCHQGNLQSLCMYFAFFRYWRVSAEFILYVASFYLFIFSYYDGGFLCPVDILNINCGRLSFMLKFGMQANFCI